MRRRGAGVMAAALVWGGLAAASLGQVRAEDVPPAPVKTGGLWGLWFKDKAAARPADSPASLPPAAAGTTPAPAGAATAPPASVVLPDDAAAVLPASTVLKQAEEALEREKQAYLRRVQVCDRLREIALETGNVEMASQADALAEEAGRVRELHTARLPSRVPTAGPAAAESESILGSRSPLSRGTLQSSEGRTLDGGRVTGEEKP